MSDERAEAVEERAWQAAWDGWVTAMYDGEQHPTLRQAFAAGRALDARLATGNARSKAVDDCIRFCCVAPDGNSRSAEIAALLC